MRYIKKNKGNGIGNTSYENSDNTKYEQIQAYPNPAKNNLTISVTTVPTTLNIYNQSGVLIKTEILLNKTNNINISEYMNGLYFFAT